MFPATHGCSSCRATPRLSYQPQPHWTPYLCWSARRICPPTQCMLHKTHWPYCGATRGSPMDSSMGTVVMAASTTGSTGSRRRCQLLGTVIDQHAANHDAFADTGHLRCGCSATTAHWAVFMCRQRDRSRVPHQILPLVRLHMDNIWLAFRVDRSAGATISLRDTGDVAVYLKVSGRTRAIPDRFNASHALF